MSAAVSKLRPPVLLVGFWVLWVATVVLVWRQLPSLLSELGLSGLVLATIWSSYTKRFSLAIFTTLVLLTIIIDLLATGQYISTGIATALLGVVIFATGLAFEYLKRPQDWRERLLNWALIALVASESYGFFSFWPISVFNKGVLVLVFFYIVWHYLEQNDGSTKSLVSHFIFSLVIAIVVLGGIIWANFPQLLLF